MNFAEVINDARSYLAKAGVQETRITDSNFLDWAEVVRDVLLQLPREEQDSAKVRNLATGLRHLRDEFDAAVKADPMILYRPQHEVAAAFHRSPAKTRFLRFANRSSKTTAANAEIYYHLTGYHPYRAIPPFPTQALVVGLDFTKYAPQVFEPKWIYGEPGNALSPIFPENGKWFHSYDAVKHILELGCKECAEMGQSKSCSHPHPRLILFSDNEGSEALSGGQYGIAHGDEEISEEFDNEMMERVKTVPNSCRIFTLTPLAGEAFWTEQKLTRAANDHLKYPDGRPIVELFTVDQFSAGLVDHDEIRASMANYNQAEIDARIFGIPATNSEFAVFDLPVLREMQKGVRESKIGALVLDRKRTAERWGHSITRKMSDAEILGQAGEKCKVAFRTQGDGWMKIWEPPRRLGQYVIGADVAEGLTGRDRSVATVLRMLPSGNLDLHFRMVAQYAGWIDPVLYAEELFKLGMLYAPSWINVEQNGPGLTCIRHMKELGCWFLYRDQTNPAAFEDDYASMFGTNTNQRSKSVIISLLQSLFKLNKLGREAITIPCAETLAELRAYVQKPTETGNSLRFAADGNAHDDRVMSIALGVYAAKTAPLYDFDLERKIKLQAAGSKGEDASHAQMVWDAVHAQNARRSEEQREFQQEYPVLTEEDGWTV